MTKALREREGSDVDPSAARNPEKWETIVTLSTIVDRTGRDLPVDRQPVYARPGMVASVADVGCGKIINVTPEVCILRLQDGSVLPVYWGDVTLCDVRPDPAHLTTTPKPKRK